MIIDIFVLLLLMMFVSGIYIVYKQQEPRKEEFIDWYKGLLTIGTIGNENLLPDLQQNPSLSQDLALEEEGKLQNELNLSEGDPEDLSLDEILDHSSSADEDQSTILASVVCSKGKDICNDNTKRAIGKKSLAFLVKKVIACRGGFAPRHSLRDPVSESRMEKV